jgi:hypothetical protein
VGADPHARTRATEIDKFCDQGCKYANSFAEAGFWTSSHLSSMIEDGAEPNR